MGLLGDLEKLVGLHKGKKHHHKKKATKKSHRRPRRTKKGRFAKR